MWEVVVKGNETNNLIKNNSFDQFDIIEKNLLTDLIFDKETNRLKFIIKHYIRKPKITRYVTLNYVKTPIYEDYSERTKIIKNFNKIINPLRFVNEDILNLDLHKKFILKIIDEIGIIPEWRKKEIKLEVISNQIKLYENSLRNFAIEKETYSFKNTSLKEESSNFWLTFFFGFFIFFLNFIYFISKKQALINKQKNEENRQWNSEHKVVIDLKNQKLLNEINNFNQDLEIKIKKLITNFNKIKETEIKLQKIDENGWIDLRNAANFNYSDLNLKKGIYIIRNKTKNKYYVGQSKNLQNRLLQNFKDGDVKNIIFAKDWYEGDNFCYKCYFCETKEQLDNLQKKYIDEYYAFEKGYNSTNGNS